MRGQAGDSMTMAASTPTKPTFTPFVPATETRPELTTRALILGALFGVLFGAVTVYVGLRAGLTVAASIPISVLSISILRGLRPIEHSRKTTSSRAPEMQVSRSLLA